MMGAPEEPGVDHIGGHDDDGSGGKELLSLADGDVAGDLFDAVGGESGGGRGLFPAEELVIGEGLGGVEDEGCGMGIVVEHGEGVEVEYQGLARCGGGGDDDIVSEIELFDGQGLVVPDGVVGVYQGCGGELDVLWDGQIALSLGLYLVAVYGGAEEAAGRNAGDGVAFERGGGGAAAACCWVSGRGGAGDSRRSGAGGGAHDGVFLVASG